MAKHSGIFYLLGTAEQYYELQCNRLLEIMSKSKDHKIDNLVVAKKALTCRHWCNAGSKNWAITVSSTCLQETTSCELKWQYTFLLHNMNGKLSNHMTSFHAMHILVTSVVLCGNTQSEGPESMPSDKQWHQVQLVWQSIFITGIGMDHMLKNPCWTSFTIHHNNKTKHAAATNYILTSYRFSAVHSLWTS